MLSRVAESLMWLSRYVERAKSLARIVEVADQLALDYSHPKLCSADLFWKPILRSYGYGEEDIEQLESKEDFHRFLLVDGENAGSVFRALTFARENARGAREQLSSELWEVLNELYLWCKDQSNSSATLNPAVYGARVRQGCLQLRGLIEEMMPREEAWCFLRLGTMLERADQTSRLLDLKTFMPGKDDDEGHAFEPYVWLCIMRGCGAGSQRGFGNVEADWPRLNQTLVYNPVFPPSIRYCVREVNNVLHELSGSALGVFNNEGERNCGRFLAELDLGAFSGEIEGDLHEFLDGVQQSLIAINEGVHQAYSYPADPVVEDDEPEEEEEPEPAVATQTQSQS
ncbi:alpha-E domain-containing protein [Roseibacillus persicicus]|uniref:alpha-E domain-containing protein n=1 Tax=Roseibacillus persicicus TaxID=454148 RepID=UPI00281094B1|nr:alpha-E domain-containing protein [Roseibacillus persicicus]MDQ8190819.1 alpha-E domain-containing protein [Roseibacillus persicicus]